MLTVSVGIISFNRREDVVECISFLAKQSRLPDEIIIDDASEDFQETHQLLIKMFSSLFKIVKLQYLNSGLGSTIQRNNIIDHCVTDIIAFIDDDSRPHTDYLKNLMGVFEADSEKRIGGIEGNVFTELEQTNTDKVASKPPPSTLLHSLKLLIHSNIQKLMNFLIGESYPREFLEPVHQIPSQLNKFNLLVCSHLYGCSMSYRTELLKNKYRFNPTLKRYGFHEDFELSYRLGRDYTLVKALDAKIGHVYSSKARLDPSLTRYLFLINIALIARTVFPQSSEITNQVATYSWRAKWCEYIMSFLQKSRVKNYRGYKEGYRETLNILNAPREKVTEIYTKAADKGFKLEKF